MNRNALEENKPVGVDTVSPSRALGVGKRMTLNGSNRDGYGYGSAGAVVGQAHNANSNANATNTKAHQPHHQVRLGSVLLGIEGSAPHK